MRVFMRLVTIGALLGSLHALLACNAILGIEEAEPEAVSTTTQAVCNTGQGIAIAECKPSSMSTLACEDCLQSKCVGATGGTLDNRAYRIALASYRSCQRPECTDDGSCSGCLTAEPSTACIAQCAPKCQGNEVLDWCTAYCTCMGQNCTAPPPQYKLHDGSTTTDCRVKCADEQGPWRLSCLLTHCEIAPSFGAFHCRHAEDSDPVCPATAPAAVACTRPDQRQVGYPCQNPSDCCTGSCVNHTCSPQ